MSIIANPVTGIVLGQPVHPNFSQQNAGSVVAAGNPVTPPAGMPLLEALSRGVVPRNSNVTSVSGVSCGAQNATVIADLCSNGAGNQMSAGVAVAGVAGNPASNGANDQQIFVGGVATAAAAGLSTGPVPTNSETLTSAPVSVNTLAGNIVLAGSFQG